MFYLVWHWHILWFFRVALVSFLFATAIQRKLFRQLPFFFTFIAWLAAFGIIMISMDYAPSITKAQYDDAYLVDTAGETALSFLLLYELLCRRLRDYPAIAEIGAHTFRVTAIGLALLAIALAWYIPAGSPVPLLPIQSLMIRSIRTLHCGLLIFIFAFCSYFRLPWRSRAFGFSLGLAWYMGSSLAINALRSQLESWEKTRVTYALYFSNEVACIIAALIWLAYLLIPETESDEPSQPPPDSDLPSWNQELRRLS